MPGLWMRSTLGAIVAVLALSTWGVPVVSAETSILTLQTSSCAADGVEHQIGGYAFFGNTTYLIRAMSVTGTARIQLRTASGYIVTFDANGNMILTPTDVPQNTILAEVTGTSTVVSRAFANEWQAGLSAGVYCVNTGTVAVTPVVKVYYEAYE